MLGLHSFGVPQFSIPQMPQTERPLHKLKDFMSFLNSLQWKADEDVKDVKDDEEAMNKDPDLRRGAEAAILGLDASLHSGHDVTIPIGSTRWDGMDDSQIWEQAMNSIVTGENPITKGYGDKIGMTPNDVDYNIFNEENPITKGYGDKIGMTPNDVDYNIFNEEEMNKMPLEKRLIGYDPYHRLEALRNSVPGIDPSYMTKVGW